MFKKCTTVGFVAFSAFLFVTAIVRADFWPQIEKTEFESASGKYLFRITPHKDWPKYPGHCKAILFKLNDEQEEVWSRYLINNIAPVDIFVTDSGKYVVTIDEWGRFGKFPVVIYGFRGKLIKVHNIESLGLERDIVHIKMTVSSLWWSEDAIIFFGPKEEYLFVRLHWGKLLIIKLYTGDLCDEDWYELSKGWLIKEEKWKQLQDYAKKKIEEIALSYLSSKAPQKRSTGALVIGQLKIHRAIPRLKELLHDEESYWSQVDGEPARNVYYIRKRAKEALKNMGINVEGIVVEEGESR